MLGSMWGPMWGLELELKLGPVFWNKEDVMTLIRMCTSQTKHQSIVYFGTHGDSVGRAVSPQLSGLHLLHSEVHSSIVLLQALFSLNPPPVIV